MEAMAIDVNWCLACNCRTEGSSAYCSLECKAAHTSASTSILPRVPSQQPLIYDTEDDVLDDFDYYPIPSFRAPTNSWVGKGVEGISAWARDVTPGPPPVESDARSTTSSSYSGFHVPSLIQRHCRAVSPSLCMSKNIPPPPKPSNPIVTPRQAVPSLSTQSATDASLTSITTAISSISIATPASQSPHDPPSAETEKAGLLAGITAHLRTWTTNTKSPIRSKTLTRDRTDAIPISPAHPTVRPSARRPRSPPSMYPIPGLLIASPSEKPRGYLTGESRREKAESISSRPPEEHPAFRTRGRKPARCVS